MNQKERIRKLDKPFAATIQLPGSKSITLRHLVMAALADGESIIHFPGICDDTLRMVECLGRLGITITKPNPNQLLVHGKNGQFTAESVKLNVGQSAASTRLLLGVALLRNAETMIDGHPSLRARPNKDLLDVLTKLGAMVQSNHDGYLPVSITGSEICNTNKVRLKGDQSSQYLSSLLMIAPLLANGLEIIVEGELVSKPYIDITIHEMNKLGVTVTHDDYRSFHVQAQRYKGADLHVEGDASAASYFSALATLHGGQVTLQNLGSATVQGDFKFINICRKLGAKVIEAQESTTVIGPRAGILSPIVQPINMEGMPDAAPTLMAMAPFIPGLTRIEGLSTLRIKECDRISASVTELRKCGVQILEGADYVEIDGIESTNDSKMELETYDDHRMAMSLAVFGTKLGAVTILNPQCVHKTYPLFWNNLSQIYDK